MFFCCRYIIVLTCVLFVLPNCRTDCANDAGSVKCSTVPVMSTASPLSTARSTVTMTTSEPSTTQSVSTGFGETSVRQVTKAATIAAPSTQTLRDVTESSTGAVEHTTVSAHTVVESSTKLTAGFTALVDGLSDSFSTIPVRNGTTKDTTTTALPVETSAPQATAHVSIAHTSNTDIPAEETTTMQATSSPVEEASATHITSDVGSTNNSNTANSPNSEYHFRDGTMTSSHTDAQHNTQHDCQTDDALRGAVL